MPNLYFKIDEKFVLTDSTEPDEDLRPLPIFPRFHEGVFSDLDISLLPQAAGKVAFGFPLGKDDLVSGEIQVVDHKTSVEVAVRAIFKVSVKPAVVDDVLSPGAKWQFRGLLEPGKSSPLMGDVTGLEREEFTRGQGEWKKTYSRYLITVRAAKAVKDLR